jgi:predicted transcriptional regulator
MAISDKQAARQILEALPDDATLDDIMYAIYVRKKIERGLRDIEEGNTVSHEDVMRDISQTLGVEEQENATYHLEREGHVAVLVADRPLPPITTEMVNELIKEMRHEREDRWLGLSDDKV